MANKKEYKAAIEKSNGTVINIAQILKLTRQAVYNYMEKNPDIAEYRQQRRFQLIDEAESVGADLLKFEDLKNPAQAAAIRQKEAQFIRNKLGKDQGWGDKQEVQHSGELSQSIQINIPPEVNDLLNEYSKPNTETGDSLSISDTSNL